MQWRMNITAKQYRFLIFGHLVLSKIDSRTLAEWKLLQQKADSPSARPGSYVGASNTHRPVYHLVTGTPESVEAVGRNIFFMHRQTFGDGACAVIGTTSTHRVRFRGDRPPLIDENTKHAEFVERPNPASSMTGLSWLNLIVIRISVRRRISIECAEASREAKAIDAILPWLAHDAMVHLAGAAWP